MSDHEEEIRAVTARLEAILDQFETAVETLKGLVIPGDPEPLPELEGENCGGSCDS